MSANLRPPPRAAAPPAPSLVPVIAVQVTVGVILAVVIWFARPDLGASAAASAEQARAVAGKLLSAGELDEAAALYERVLWEGPQHPDHGRMAFSLGDAYLGQGRLPAALRWFYEAETVGGAPAETGARIVHCLEALGRVNEAEAALATRAAFGNDVQRADTDPVAARIGDREIRASEVLRALDDLPAQLTEPFQGPEGRAAFLQKFVADELLWQKALKLELDGDPEVLRRLETVRRQVVLDAFVEREIAGQITIDEADLQNFYAAQAARYAPADPEGTGEPGAPPPLEEVRAQVERDYRLLKMQSAYQDMVLQQIEASGVELLPEALGGAP